MLKLLVKKKQIHKASFIFQLLVVRRKGRGGKGVQNFGKVQKFPEVKKNSHP